MVFKDEKRSFQYGFKKAYAIGVGGADDYYQWKMVDMSGNVIGFIYVRGSLGIYICEGIYEG